MDQNDISKTIEECNKGIEKAQKDLAFTSSVIDKEKAEKLKLEQENRILKKENDYLQGYVKELKAKKSINIFDFAKLKTSGDITEEFINEIQRNFYILEQKMSALERRIKYLEGR